MAPSVTEYRIRLEGIRFRARHGVSRAERDLLQDFVVDLEVALPVELLPATDKRSCVYDYDALASLVVDEGTKRSHKLLETLARRLLKRVLSDTAAVAATVRLRKFGPPTKASVDTVAIELSGTTDRAVSRAAVTDETDQLGPELTKRANRAGCSRAAAPRRGARNATAS